QYTSWINPNQEYDEAVVQFVSGALEGGATPFRKALQQFQKRGGVFGRVSSLVQLLFKLPSPGGPDIYPGAGVWEFRLVDPDNRRRVDYEVRKNLLRELSERLAKHAQDPGAVVAGLLEAGADGRIKLYLTMRTLQLRKQRRALFERGGYVPVTVLGGKAEA